MSIQKMLVIITLVLVVIVVGSILLIRPAPSPKKLAAPIPFQVFTPTTQVLPKEDLSVEYAPTTPIELTFSGGYNLDDLKITFNPPSEVIYYSVNSKTLRILPKTSWKPGRTTLTLPNGSLYTITTAWPKTPDEGVEY